jgi:hypothetical protein
MPATSKKPRKKSAKSYDHATAYSASDAMTDDNFKSELCCCPPVAHIWIDSRSHCCFIENEIDMSRRLLARADANASVRPPGGPEVDAEGAGGSQLDEGTFKKQGKVYRIDEYTIHWEAVGQCRPLDVNLRVGGDLAYQARHLPERGDVVLSHAYILEPPNYDAPTKVGINATLVVSDCAGNRVENGNVIPRP